MLWQTMEQVKAIQEKPVVEEMALAQSFGCLETRNAYKHPFLPYGSSAALPMRNLGRTVIHAPSLL